MRLIRSAKLKNGVELGQIICALNGMTLLKKGITLRKSFTESINRIKFKSIYIERESSKSANAQNSIDEQLRYHTVQKMKNLLTTEVVDEDKPRTLSNDMLNVSILLEDMMDQIIDNGNMVSNLLNLRNYDDYTFQHSVNVAATASVLGLALGYNYEDLLHLAKGALFHDIGKMLVDIKILNKPGKLTIEEFEEIKKHPKYGYEYAKKHLHMHEDSLICILQHHEKFNGNGYPDSKEGKKIHRNAQIVAIADVYDAITSKRVYNEPVLPSEAIEYIMANADYHFDSDIVDVFLEKVAVYPLGTCVKLSNGLKGLICENYEGYVLRPKIELIKADHVESQYLNLMDKKNSAITIIKILPKP